MAKDAKALEDRRRRHVALWGEVLYFVAGCMNMFV